VVKELEQAAAEQQAADGDLIREDLRLLYLQIERGEISEAEFEAREGPLLDRLEKLEDRHQDSEGEEDDELEREEEDNELEREEDGEEEEEEYAEEPDRDEDGEDHPLAEESENGLSIAYAPEDGGPSVQNTAPTAGKDVPK